MLHLMIIWDFIRDRMMIFRVASVFTVWLRRDFLFWMLIWHKNNNNQSIKLRIYILLEGNKESKWKMLLAALFSYPWTLAFENNIMIWIDLHWYEFDFCLSLNNFYFEKRKKLSDIFKLNLTRAKTMFIMIKQFWFNVSKLVQNIHELIFYYFYIFIKNWTFKATPIPLNLSLTNSGFAIFDYIFITLFNIIQL